MRKLNLVAASMLLVSAVSANAEYVVKFPIEGIIFVQPKSHEHMCEATARYTEEYARSIGVNISVYTGWAVNRCNVDVTGIDSFSNVDQLMSVANYINRMNSGEYARYSVIYGFNDGLGRQLIYDGEIFAYQAWEEK